MSEPSREALAWWSKWGEQIVHGAVARGRARYFADSRRQEEAFREWEQSGYEGDCRQCTNGSLDDYITRSVLAIPHPSDRGEEGRWMEAAKQVSFRKDQPERFARAVKACCGLRCDYPRCPPLCVRSFEIEKAINAWETLPANSEAESR